MCKRGGVNHRKICKWFNKSITLSNFNGLERGHLYMIIIVSTNAKKKKDSESPFLGLSSFIVWMKNEEDLDLVYQTEDGSKKAYPGITTDLLLNYYFFL